MFLLYLTSALDLDLYILLEACTLARASTHTSLTMPEEAQHLMAEPMQLLGLLTILPAPEIEHLYTHLGRAYELNEEWKKARAVYTMMLAHARDACQPAMESAAWRPWLHSSSSTWRYHRRYSRRHDGLPKRAVTCCSW